MVSLLCFVLVHWNSIFCLFIPSAMCLQVYYVKQDISTKIYFTVCVSVDSFVTFWHGGIRARESSDKWFQGGGGGNLRNTIFAVTSFLNGPYTTGFFKIVSFAKKNNFWALCWVLGKADFTLLFFLKYFRIFGHNIWALETLWVIDVQSIIFILK